MNEDKGILIKNIYYMLSYAYRVLNHNNYKEIEGEEFNNIHDLLATIITKGFAQQLKQGLHREYVLVHNDLSTVRGKLDMNGVIRHRIQNNHRLTCEFDELSENNTFNQIIKITLLILIKQQSVCAKNKSAINKILPFLENVELIKPSSIKWDMICYRRNNQSYRMLLDLCYFVIDGLLLSTEYGKYRLRMFSDEHMSKLYERFILEYYRRHLSNVRVAASQVAWNTDEDNDKFLPTMQTDVMLTFNERVLIIDAKYYGKTMQTRFDKETYHSGNMYQIFTYVKNCDKNSTGEVSGLLLYAKTQESVTPNNDIMIGGNRISVQTLDLNLPFAEIAKRLSSLAKSFLEYTDNRIELTC